MKNLRLSVFAVILPALIASGCQDRLVVADNSPFGEGVLRLGDTEVAAIDGTKIYLSDVERTAAAKGLIEEGSPLTPGQPIFQQTLDELIDQRLLALDALRRSLDQDDETRRRLSAARERILGNALVEQHLRETVNEASIRRMYDEQSGLRNRGDEVLARHILLATEEDAIEAAQSLEAGKDFAALARELSQDTGTQERGGDLGYFTKDMLDSDFTDIVFATPVGTRAKPFKTQYGWHIVEVQKRRAAAQPSFENMRSEILNFMTYDEIQNILTRLRAQGDVKLLFGQAASAPSATGEAAPNTPSANNGSIDNE